MSELADKGPWVAGKWPDGRVVLQSDDFTHDVALIVTGDFGDVTKRLAYAKALAAQFNAAALPLAPQVAGVMPEKERR